MKVIKELDTWLWLGVLSFGFFLGYSFYCTEHYDIIAGQFWVVSMLCIGVSNIIKHVELRSLELQKFLLERTAIVVVGEDMDKIDC